MQHAEPLAQRALLVGVGDLVDALERERGVQVLDKQRMLDLGSGLEQDAEVVS